MASNRQNEANRNNAKRSTGPKTEAGKSKSSNNARCHGLSRPVIADETILIALKKAIGDVGAASSADIDLGEVALAKFELNRIRTVRYELLSALLKDPDLAKAKRLMGLKRYERLAFAKQRRATRTGCQSGIPD
jgi:hypothetical protein